MLHCVESFIRVWHRAKACRVDVHEETWCPFIPCFLQICHVYECTFRVLHLYVLHFSVKTWPAYFCKVNSNGRCSPFVCCICFVRLPCLSRYTVDCSVWNVSCTCVSARLYFVTEDDLLKSSFTFFLATSRQLFHFIHAIQLHRQYFSCVKFHAFAMFGKTVYNVIKRFWQRLFSAILDSLWGLLKGTFEPSWQPSRSFS